MNSTVSTIWLFPRTGLFRWLAVFPAAVFLLPVLVFTSVFFGADFFLPNLFLGVTFLLAFRFVCFFLDFFLVAIGEVYHLSAIYGATAAFQVKSTIDRMTQFPIRLLFVTQGDHALRICGA